MISAMFRIGSAGARGADVDVSHPLYQQLARQYHYLRDPLLDLKDDVDFDDAIRSLVLEQTTSRRMSTASTLVAKEEGQQRPAPSSPPTDRTIAAQKRWRLAKSILRRSRSKNRKGS